VILDGDDEYNGRGVKRAIQKINAMEQNLMMLSCNATDINGIDNYLQSLDSSSNKSNVGGNTMIALSMAFCKMCAALSDVRVDEYLSIIGGFDRKMPVPHFNLLNGGAHSGNGMSVQEIMVAYQYDDLERNIESVCVLYESLRKIIAEKYGSLYVSVGDEGGYAPPIQSIEEGLDLIIKASEMCGRTNFRFAIDFAANEFYRNGKYIFDRNEYSTSQLGKKYLAILASYPQIYSLEDPFHEGDYEGWRWLTENAGAGINIVGDDLTVTNPRLVDDAGTKRLCNVLLVKPNQIGTVSEVIEAIKIAHIHNMKIMVSHRSGETEDCFISDLAVGVGAEYIKAGAPCRGERVAKYNQLLRLNENRHNV
jgi:enolase